MPGILRPFTSHPAGQPPSGVARAERGPQGADGNTGIFLVGASLATGTFAVGASLATGIFVVGASLATGIFVVGSSAATGIFVVGDSDLTSASESDLPADAPTGT